MLKLTRTQIAPLVLGLCALTALVSGCGQKAPSPMGPQNTNPQTQLLRFGKPIDCIRAEAALEQGINQDRNTVTQAVPANMKDSQRLLEEILSQFSAHAQCAAAVPSYGKKLAHDRAKALEDERTLKFYEHVHADILNSTIAAAERILGSGNRCERSEGALAAEMDSNTDLLIECVVPTQRVKQYISFVALDKSSGEPRLQTWRVSHAASALRSQAAAYSLEVRGKLWHSFNSRDDLNKIDSDKYPTVVFRNQSTRETELTFDGSSPQAMAKFRKDVFAKLLPASCPR